MDSKNGLMCLGPPCRLSGDRMIPCSDREISSEQGRKKDQRSSNAEFTVSHEVSTLRDELEETHKAYRNDILSYEKHIHCQSTHIKDLEEIVNKRTSEITELERTMSLAQWHRQHMENLKLELEKENEKWIGVTLKFQYLFEQMDKIGLKQSEDIFDCFRDIKVPGVCVHIREKYVPTELTNAFSDDEDDDLVLSDDDDLSLSDDDIIGEEDVNDEEDVTDDGGDGDVISNSVNDPPSLDLSLVVDTSRNLINFNRRDHTFSEVTEMWTFYTEKGIIDTITWPKDHLELAAERYSLNKPDMPRTLQIHLVELCMEDRWYDQAEIMAGIAWAAEDLGWNEVIQKVITIQRIFRGYRVRKSWLDIPFP
tara:strand:- start:2721 stop:3818 length:1098 start_codon:yes stop_codon:yes gene_type:complete